MASAQPPAKGLTAGPKRSFIPVAVFGADERKALPQSRAPVADYVGILSAGESPFCTAFCVANDVIVTASHCLLGTQQMPGPDLERVSFAVGSGQRHASKLAGEDRTRIRAQLRSGTPLLRITPPIAAARDWAIVRLAKPICHAGGLPFSSKSRDELDTLAHAGEIYQVAMHRDLSPDAVVVGGPCALPKAFPQAGVDIIALDFLEPSSILMHTCDTGPGSSGSPLLIDGANGPEVAGINVGTYVLSRTATSTSGTSSPAAGNEAIANTAIKADRLQPAVELFKRETSLPDGGRMHETHDRR